VSNILLIAFISLMMLLTSSEAPRELRLKLVDSRSNQLFPISRDYAALLINDKAVPVSIQAVQMPGGYAGSGRFYACSLQFWSSSRKKWVTPRPAMFSDFGHNPPPIVKVELKPGDALEVCHSLLPQQQGHIGDSVRFALSLVWGKGPTVFSNRFTILGPEKPHGFGGR